jgi:hypothetical protein
MKQEQFEQAKVLLARIADLEKKAERKADYNYVKIMVSSNGSYFSELSSIIGVEAADEYKSNIISDCNKHNEGLSEEIRKLQSQFDEL